MKTVIKGYLQDEAKCPYCHKELLRIPKRKSRCPVCRETFYVLKRFDSSVRYIVTGEDALRIKAEWEEKLLKTIRFRRLAEVDCDYSGMVNVARSYRQREYLDEAISVIQTAKDEAIAAGDYLACLEILREMAEIFMQAEKDKEAFAVYCEHNYLCLCGVDDVQNVNELVDLGLIDDTHYGTPWNPEKMGLSDAEVFSMELTAHQLTTDRETLKNIIMDTCKNVYEKYSCLLEPEVVLPDLMSIVDGTSGILSL